MSQQFSDLVDAAMRGVFDGLVKDGLMGMRARLFTHMASMSQQNQAEIARLQGELVRAHELLTPRAKERLRNMPKGRKRR